MLALELDEFMVELKDGSIKNVGAPTKSAEAKLFDPETVEVREFGDSQVKIAAEDASGNEVQIAMLADQFEDLQEQVEEVQDQVRDVQQQAADAVDVEA